MVTACSQKENGSSVKHKQKKQKNLKKKQILWLITGKCKRKKGKAVSTNPIDLIWKLTYQYSNVSIDLLKEKYF